METQALGTECGSRPSGWCVPASLVLVAPGVKNMLWVVGSTRRLAYMVEDQKHLAKRRGGAGRGLVPSRLHVRASPPGGVHEIARPLPELGPCGPPSPPRHSAAGSAERHRLPRLWAVPQSVRGLPLARCDDKDDGPLSGSAPGSGGRAGAAALPASEPRLIAPLCLRAEVGLAAAAP